MRHEDALTTLGEDSNCSDARRLSFDYSIFIDCGSMMWALTKCIKGII